jgi:hypothetical protein
MVAQANRVAELASFSTSRSAGRSSDDSLSRPLAEGLGWFSIGLGLAEVLAPNAMARLVGMPRQPTLVRLYGLRELAAGIGILRERRPTTWLAARVAGDALDLATLAANAAARRSDGSRLGLAAVAVAGVTLLDIVSLLRMKHA